jgi:beta-lactamase regulating signal transducer with metallopeptidase domain
MNALRALAVAWPWSRADVLTHLWQSTVVAAAVLLMLAFSRGLTARTRQTIGWLALVKFALPVGGLVSALARASTTPERWTGADALAGPILRPAFIMAAPATIATTRIPFEAIVTAAWIVGFVVIFASWLWRGLAARWRILAGASPASAATVEQIARAAARVGLRPPPSVLEVASERGPAILGLLAPIVIVPRGLGDTLAPAEFEAVMIHELVHARRRDNLWSAVRALFVAVFWFHPLVWQLNRRLAAEAELSCDERVLEITGAPEAYASAILKSVQHALGLALPGLAGMTSPPIVTRVRNILGHGARRDRPVVRVVALMSGVALVALSGGVGTFAADDLADGPTRESSSATNTSRADLTGITAGATRRVPSYGYNEFKGAYEVNGFNFGKTMSGEFADKDIRDVIRAVADFVEVNVVMPDALAGTVTLRVADKTWREVFKAVLDPVGYTFYENRNIVMVVRAHSPEAAAGRRVERERARTAPVTKRGSGTDMLSVDFPNTDVRQILLNVSNLFALDLMMPDALQGKVTVKLRDVTWRQIFDVVLDPIGYTFVEDGSRVTVVTKQSLRDGADVTAVFLLNYARAGEVRAKVEDLIAPTGGKVVVDARTNSLVITARASDLSRARSFVAQLDRATDVPGPTK